MSDAVSPNAQSPSLDGWYADSARFSLFVGDGRSWPDSLLAEFFGQSLEFEQTSKRGASVTKLEAVRIGDYQINSVAQTGRLDINISVVQTPQEPDRIVLPIDSFRDLLTTLALKSSKLTPFTRVGVGASLIKACGNKTEVYKALQAKFPCLGIDPEQSDDFMLQLNRLLATEAAKINRIERWSYGKFERIDIPIMGLTPDIVRVASRVEGMKLDLDFNTIPSATTFDAGTSHHLMETLISAIYDKVKVA